MSLVACDDGKIVGDIIYSKAKVINDNNDKFDVLCMGPTGVSPSLCDSSLRGISGKFHDDGVFKIEDDELEIFEKECPHKEKLVTDTQLK